MKSPTDTNEPRLLGILKIPPKHNSKSSGKTALERKRQWKVENERGSLLQWKWSKHLSPNKDNTPAAKSWLATDPR